MKMSSTAAYRLRENPKKSLRVSDGPCSGSGTTSSGLSDIVCRICGKGFSTSRQLCGHLRHHTIVERRAGVVCKECGKTFNSIRSWCGHMKSHSSVCDGIGTIRASAVVTDCSLFLIPCVGVWKRARTPRFQVSRKRSIFEFEKGEVSSALEEEVAASLIKLSQGLEFSNATVDVVGNCDVELVDQCLTSDGFKPVKSEDVDITGFDSCEKISSEMDLDICENPGKSEDPEFVTVEISRVKDERLFRQIELGGVCIVNSDSVKTEDGAYGVSSSGLKYKCISCNKDFSSHQALGGHRSSKHRWRKCLKSEICERTKAVAQGTGKKPECPGEDVQMGELCAVGIPHCELLERSDHKCTQCFKVFQSAQALGGHMGAHVAEKTMIDQVQQLGSKSWYTSALKNETFQADHVSVTEGTSEKPKSIVNDVQNDETYSTGVAHFELLRRCKHKCAICFKLFRSAQALGAHMRGHVAESSATTGQVQQRGGSIQDTSVVELSMIPKSPLASWQMIVS